MSKKKKQRILMKRISCLLIAGLTALSTISLPVIKTDASVNPTSYTVTAGNTSIATFTHTHAHSGTQVTDALVQTNKKYSGYTQSGGCYTNMVVHEHEGNKTTGGVCFEGHKHTPGTGGTAEKEGVTYYKQPGGCYQKQVSVNFSHIAGTDHDKHNCADGGTGTTDEYSYRCSYCDKLFWHAGWECQRCHARETADADCKHTVYTLSCGKTESSYQLKEPCGFYTDPVYTLSCGIDDGAIMAMVYVRAENDNTLSYELGSVNPHATVTRTWTVPAGSAVNKNADSFRCDVPGNYVCTVTVAAVGNNGETVESDTATFTYTAVAQNTNVKFVSDGSTFATRTMKNGSEDATVDIPEKTGYNFLGWYDGDTQIYSQYGNLKNAAKGFCPLNGGTVTLNAKFEPKSYNIRYTIVNSNLETETQISQSVLYDQENVKLEQAAKQYDGYTFLGFYHGDTKYFDTEGNYVETSGKWQRTSNLAVVAKYQANTYTLNYNLNKEDPVGTQSQTITFDEDYDLTAEDKANRKEYKGYTFLGWVDDILGVIFKADGSKDATQWKYTQDVNAKATYEANPYTVSYYVENTAEEAKTDVTDTFTYDAAATLSKTKKEYPGWTFSGWYKGSEKLFNTDGTYINPLWDIDENITVTPKFDPINYTLNYSLNKEEAVTAHTKTIPFNSVYGLSAQDKKDRAVYKGYTFLGWYDGDTQIFDADGNNTDTGIWRTVGNINAKATYEANPHTVTYYVENPAEETTVSVTDTFVYDTANIKLSATVKSYNGWTLAGFYNGSEKVFNADGTFVRDTWDIDEDITVTPKWTPKKYTLNFSLNKEEDVTANTREINFNSAYGLTAEEKAARKSYKGYTFNGWYDGEDLIFDENGNNTDTGVWRFLRTVNAKATYTPNPYTVYYNTNESDAPTKTLAVTFDADYRLPEGAVNEVPLIQGYTFDGWFDADGNKVFKVNGTPVETPYNYDHDITVYVKYHKNKYTVHYNNGTISDETLDKSVVVTFDESYIDIAEAPYKKGYVFDGHSIKGTTTFIWDGKGNKTHAIWDFVCGVDGTEINAVKNYHPKTFHVSVGSDFDDDDVIDSVENVYDTTYDATYFDVTVPAKIDGYTFDGYYLLENKVWIATYDPATNTLTKASETWDQDDNLNWVDDVYTGNFTVVRKWHKNAYTVKYNNTDTTDTSLKSEQKVIYGREYSDIAQAPYKKGYVFQGHYIKDTANTEYQLWDNKGKVAREKFDVVLGDDNAIGNAYKKYDAKTFTVSIGPDFDDNGDIDSVEKTETATFDAAYFDLEVPAAIDGYTFDGYYLVENDTWVATYDAKAGTLTKESNTWIWDDSKDWVNEEHTGTFTIIKKWHRNTYTVRYNNSNTTDTDLSSSQTVIFGRNYTKIAKAPYKKGYVFQGHFIKDVSGTEYKLWDNKGLVVRDPFDIVLGEDGATGSALKKYDAKVLTLNIGEDYNEDKALDSVKATQTVTFDGEFTLPAAEEKTGLTFVGYYLLGTDTCIASYNKATKTMTYTSSTWIWDDGDDWVDTGATSATILVEQRYSRNEYTATIKTTTDALNDDGSYKVNTETKKFTYDRTYDAITVPTKQGYDFGGYKVVGGTYDGQTVWGADGKATVTAWLLAENVTINAVWTPRTYHVKYPEGEFDIVYDAEIPNVKTSGKTGHTFQGYRFPEANGSAKVFGSDGKPATKVWRYDIGANGTIVTLESIFDVNYYNIYTEYGGEFPDETIGVSYGSKYGNLKVPAKKGYKLLGYVAKGTKLPEDLNNLTDVNFIFDANGIGDKYYNDASDTTVVPVWKAETYTIRLGNTGKTITVTYDAKAPSYTGDAPSKEYCDFLGWYYGTGVLYRADGTPTVNIWNLDLGEDGAVVTLPAHFTDPVIPVEPTEDDSEEPSEEPSEETSEEITSEHPFEPVVKPEEKPEEPKKENKVLDTLLKAAPYVGITTGVVVFFGAATVLVLSILFGIGRIGKLYNVNNSSKKKKFAQLVFVGNMSGYEKTGLTSLRINLPRKYYNILNNNLDNTLVVVQLSKSFVIKNVGKKISIGCGDLNAEYDVAEMIEV